MKKLVSILLAVVMILSSMTAFAFAAESDKDIPIVCVHGYGSNVYLPDGTVVYPPESNYDILEYVKEVTPGVLEELAISLLTDNWDGYCDALYEAIAKLYEGFPLDGNGESSNGSFVNTSRNEALLKNPKKSDYHVCNFTFGYDWRKSPLEIADELNAFINTLLDKTGHSKVGLVGRCLGSSVVSAYIAKYGTSKVDSLVYYVPTANGGVETVNALFTGDIQLDPTSVDRFVNYYINRKGLVGDEVMDDFIIALFSLLTYCQVLPTFEDALETVYAKVKANVVPRLLLACYGGLPSFWSMLNSECYEDAKAFVFNGREDEYAGFIKKIDEYNYSVKEKLPDLLKDFENEGGRVAVIAKYGLNMPPLSKRADVQGDAMVATTNLSFGATCSDIDKKLPQSYIDKGVASGTDKYISADKKVDASTCLFPDTTWFIKNIPHADFPDYISDLIYTFIQSGEKVTVWDFENWPQYMNYNMQTGEISAVTDNENEDSRWTNNIVQALIRFLTSLLKVLTKLISNSK
ncbi:MAG: alpha/beta fold hydrolase [Acutalibacteraceae bacterium]